MPFMTLLVLLLLVVLGTATDLEARPRQRNPVLTVTIDGSGTGSVTSDVGGINCDSTCSTRLFRGTAVTLTAFPAADSTFSGWSGGGCFGNGTCSVILDSSTTVMATFTAAGSPPPPPPPSDGMFYTTTFKTRENPLDENGRWTEGRRDGLDWQDVAVFTPGLAGPAATQMGFDDATAILTGPWGPDQYVSVVINRPTLDPIFALEIQIRLRSDIQPHSIKGYEILECQQIVRWNGPLGDFTYLSVSYPTGSVFPLSDGDTFSAQMVGNMISVFRNGVLCMTAMDGTFASGNPGIGFDTGDPNHPAFGISSFTASSSPITP